MICGCCKGRHDTAAQVQDCYAWTRHCQDDEGHYCESPCCTEEPGCVGYRRYRDYDPDEDDRERYLEYYQENYGYPPPPL